MIECTVMDLLYANNNNNNNDDDDDDSIILYIYNGVVTYNLCFFVVPHSQVGLPIALANEIGYTQSNAIINEHNGSFL